MIPTAATTPNVDGFQRAAHLDVKHLQAPAQIIRRVDGMSAVKLEIERPSVVRWQAIPP